MTAEQAAAPSFPFVCHHKAGTALFTQVLNVFSEIYELPLYVLDGDWDAPAPRDRSLLFWLSQGWHQTTPEVVAQAYETPEERPLRGIHIIRDPRDMIVSGYYSHLKSHNPHFFERVMTWYRDKWPLGEYRAALQQMDKGTGLLAELDFMEWTFRQMDEWDYSDTRYLTVRFEDYVLDPDPMIIAMTDHLGLPRLSQEQTAYLKHRTAFKNASGGRDRGTEDTNHHLRKGVPGDWVNHFTPELTERFNRRWPNLLKTLGYL